ncbi:PD-(D/E)XK motif protein [Bacillus spizizenii]|uniref:PD-(D/E)XK motif protein n=1 Tax=Bacillus spizizenii TaxID=96241 RepID=UPI001F622A90|nr:PD-(D/E)XK motif protein [Bacillus spizizenii]MCI4167256.1 PD-(D/E)XK motif protein [Bacillus spizizenii]
MINLTEEFKKLLDLTDNEQNEQVYKLKTIHFKIPIMMIGIDLITRERRIYIDISNENWNDDQMKSLPKWRGVKVTKDTFDKIGPLINKRFLIIAQEEEDSEEIFEKLLQSLVDHILVSEGRSLFTVIYGVLDRWHNFFRFKTNKRLSLEEQMGLFGELYYINTWLNKFVDEPPLIIDAWKGPTKHRIDFVKKRIGIEIKTISQKIHDGIRISNETQLELNNVIRKIYLYVLKIEHTQSDDGKSIQNLIDDIRFQLNVRSKTGLVRFNDILLELYISDDMYNDVYFYIHNEETYEVTEKFPKIISDNLPIGVTNVSYKIDLSHCVEFKVETDKAYYSSKVG